MRNETAPIVTTITNPYPSVSDGEIEVSGSWEYDDDDPVQYVEVYLEGILDGFGNLATDNKSFTYQMFNFVAGTYDIHYIVYYKSLNGSTNLSKISSTNAYTIVPSHNYLPVENVIAPIVTTTTSPDPGTSEGVIEISGSWDFAGDDPIEYVELDVETKPTTYKINPSALNSGHKSFTYQITNLIARDYIIHYDVYYKNPGDTSVLSLNSGTITHTVAPSYIILPPTALQAPIVTTTEKPTLNGGTNGKINIKGSWTVDRLETIEYVDLFVGIDPQNLTQYKIENWDLSSDKKSFSYDIQNLGVGAYTIEYIVHYKDADNATGQNIKSPVIPPYVIEESVPPTNVAIAYDVSGHTKPSQGVSNGKIDFLGTFDDTDGVVNKVEIQTSFDGEPWTAKKTIPHAASSFVTTLENIPKGEVKAKGTIWYDAQGPGTSDDGSILIPETTFTMEELADPDMIGSPIILQATQNSGSWLSGDSNSEMNVSSVLIDTHEQIDTVQVWSKKTSDPEWMTNKENAQYNPVNKIINHDVLGLENDVEYEFNIVATLKTTGKEVVGTPKIETTAVLETPTPPTITNITPTEPTDWGDQNGKVEVTIDVPAAVSNVKVYLKNNAISTPIRYEYLGPVNIVPGTNVIEFIGDASKPIIASPYYEIEIGWSWESKNSNANGGNPYNSGTQYFDINGKPDQFDNIFSSLIEVGPGQELAPTISTTPTDSSAIVTQPTDTISKDGKIDFEFKIINNYNSRIETIEVKLYNKTSGPSVYEESIIFHNPLANKKISGQFKGLPTNSVYEIKIYATYILSGAPPITTPLIAPNSFGHLETNDSWDINPKATFSNVKPNDVKSNPVEVEDYGSIEFDYEIDNGFPSNNGNGSNNGGSDFVSHTETTYIHLYRSGTLLANKNISIDTSNISSTNPIVGTGASFTMLESGEYQIKIVSKFKNNHNDGRTEEVIGQTDKIIIGKPTEISLYATKDVDIKPERNEFILDLNVIDANRILKEDSLTVEIIINDKSREIQKDLKIGKHEIILDIDEVISSYEIKLTAEYKTDESPPGSDGLWHGDNVWLENQKTTFRIIEEKDFDIVIMVSVISGVTIFLFSVGSVLYYKKR